jgi:hypothetical protein
VEELLVNPNTSEVFYTGNFSRVDTASTGIVDYAYSSDYGTTWRLDSSFGLHLWRLANPAPGILWAMIGQSGPGEVGGFIEVFPPVNAVGSGFENDYSSKIGYSSDNGKTWTIDSTTFINDSLEEMHFLDARHGWIASWSNDSLFMWYYDADANSGVVEHGSPNPTKFVVYPNPTQNWITIFGASATVSITDDLGRLWTCPGNGSMFDVSSLPSGIYIASDGQSRAKFVKE